MVHKVNLKLHEFDGYRYLTSPTAKLSIVGRGHTQVWKINAAVLSCDVYKHRVVCV